MDRYEYNVKSDQIKKLYAKKDYETAAVIADSIDWSRVKNNGMLAMVADAYEGTKQYDKARNVLEIAYERSPMGRQLAYRLTILAIRMRDFVAADQYYQEFTQMAPRDVAQYILKYRIARAKGEAIETLISILEAYVDVEMDERWQYELAKLYHEAGEDDKCIEMCDKIILWFSEGKYVTKALELKMRHKPLTEEQQAKYDGKWDYYNERIKASETPQTDTGEQENDDTKNDDNNLGQEAKETDEEQQESENEPDVSIESEISNDDLVAQNEQPPVRDILNDTTALDYLTDYSEDEKVTAEPDTSEPDELTAMEVEINISKIVAESMESALKDAEGFEAAGEESDENSEEESEEESEEIAGEDIEVEAEETSGEESDGEAAGDSEEISSDEEANDEATSDKIEIYEFNQEKNGNAKGIGEELMKTAEIDIDEINLKVDSPDNLYDTANIQKALAQSMQIIMKAESEKATRNAFSRSELLDEPTKRFDISGGKTGERADIQMDIDENEITAENVTSSTESAKEENEKVGPVYVTVPLPKIYDREEDGQIKLSEPAQEEDEQIDGQMSIEEVLIEIEKSKVEALKEAKRKEQLAMEAAKRATEEVAIAREAVRKAIEEENAAKTALEKASEVQKVIGDYAASKENPDKEEMLTQDLKAALEQIQQNVAATEESDEVTDEANEYTQEELPEETIEKIQEENEEITEDEAETDDITADTTEELEKVAEEKEQDSEDGIEESSDDSKTDSENKGLLSDEDKKLFVDFLDIPELEEQISATLNNLVDGFVKDGTSRTNNVIIMGDSKIGKTTLGLGIIKSANRGRMRPGRKVAKVKATALNRKGVGPAMSQILGTDLIIEQAGNLMPGTVVDLMAAMKSYTEEMIIVLEDDKAALERLVTAHPVLEEMFTNQIYIREFGIDDFVKIAREYAEQKQYVIDEMGTLALYAKIDDINGKNQGISRPEIYEIVDQAISHAEKFKISRLIGKLKRTHYEMGVLKEEDFE